MPENLTRQELESIIEITKLKESMRHVADTMRINQEMMAKMSNKIDSLTSTIRKDRDDLKLEIERDFMTKQEARTLQVQLETKIDNLRSRIAWTVGTIVAIGGIIQFLFYIFILAKKVFVGG